MLVKQVEELFLESLDVFFFGDGESSAFLFQGKQCLLEAVADGIPLR